MVFPWKGLTASGITQKGGGTADAADLTVGTKTRRTGKQKGVLPCVEKARHTAFLYFCSSKQMRKNRRKHSLEAVLIWVNRKNERRDKNAKIYLFQKLSGSLYSPDAP